MALRRSCYIGLTILACSVASGRWAWGEYDAYRHFFFDQPRSLPLDSNRIAIFESEAGTTNDSLRAELEAHGISVLAIDDLPIPPWRLVTLAAARNTDSAAASESALDLLKGAGAFEFTSPVFFGDDGGPVIVTREILMRFDRQVLSSGTADRLLADMAFGEILERDWAGMPGAYRIQSSHIDGRDVLLDANRLATLPGVRFAEPNMVFTGGGAQVPDDPGFGNCWGLHNTGQFGGLPDFDIDAPEAWSVTIGNPTVVVVVIDVGVQQNHPDIHQIPGIDVTTEPSANGGPGNAFDRHGTAVAGSITAIINNAMGIVGVAPECVSASARTFISIDNEGKWITESQWTVDSLDWAHSIGARVTNNSNFYGFQSSAIADKYEETRNAGVVHFASAGNNANPWVEYPAILPSVNAVGAVRNTGTLASFSSYGPDMDWVAPGEDIYTTDRTGSDGFILGNYVFLSGTSFGSSYSAGVAGLFLSAHPDVSAVGVEEGLRQSAVDLGVEGRDDTYGWGMVNAAQAVAWDPGCDSTQTAGPEPGGVAKNRYIAFSPATTSRRAAYRLTLLVLPQRYEALKGQTFWVDEPFDAVASVNPPQTFKLAKLTCTPVYRDWSDVSLVSVTGPAIIPGSTYSIQAVYESCDPAQPANFSAPFLTNTARWGDVTEPFNPPDPRTQPDFTDVSAIVNRFRSAPGAPLTASTDLEPAQPNQDTNFADISNVIDAFKGVPYTMAGPCPCGQPCP